MEQVGLSMMSKFGPETPDGTKKSNAISKRIVQPERSFPAVEKISKNQTEVYIYNFILF